MSKYWRGFIPLDSRKRSMMTFKGIPDEKLLTEDSADKFDNYAGVLAPGIVLLDFDDEKHAEKALRIVKAMNLQCKVFQTTRGCHLLFKGSEHYPKNNIGQRLACGLKCDIKCGDRNSYEVLKLNGEKRELKQECDEPQVAPAYFYPLDSDTELFGLKEGDGRNETLFSYILTMTNKGFTKDETEECADIINRFIFDSPLDTKEYATVTRDEAFDSKTPAFKDKKGKFQHNLFGDWLLSHERIIRVSGRLCIYNDGVYIPGEEAIERAMITHVPDITMAKRKEVFEYLLLKVNADTPIADARYIPFENGIYDIVEDRMLEFSPDIIVTSKIPHSYDPKAHNELVIKTMMKLANGNTSIYNLLGELIGYLFWRRNELGASFFLLGGGSNGKSTFISMLRYLLGTQNMTALSLADLNKEFRVAELYGKLANLGDDIEDFFIEDTSVFKKVATGNSITVSPKYERVFTFAPTAKLVFSANEMPRMKDGTGAALRRIVPITFEAKFSKEDPDYDPYIIYKLNTEDGASTLINLGLEGLKRVIVNNSFSEYEEMDEVIRTIDKLNNPLGQWLEEYGHPIMNQSVNGLYKSYALWCYEAGVNAMSKPTWKNQMVRRLGYKVIKIDGKNDTKIDVFSR